MPSKTAKKNKHDTNAASKEYQKLLHNLRREIEVDEKKMLRYLLPSQGQPFVYRCQKIRGKKEPVLDLGFSNHYELAKVINLQQTEFSTTDCIEVIRTNGKFISRKSIIEKDHLFTYRVNLQEVTSAVSGWFDVDLGFGLSTSQQLPLRGLKVSNLDSKKKAKARRFLNKTLSKSAAIQIKSYKSQKAPTYLADVFYKNNGDVRWHFLNQEMLDEHLVKLSQDGK